MPISNLLNQPILFLMWVLAVVFALTVHEFSHALAARLQGDKTAEYMGRLTLNPLAHIDWVGFLLLVIAGFGWAKPTPFNPYNLKNKRLGSALVAFAGPISNAVSVLLVGGALAVLVRTTAVEPDNLVLLFLTMVVQVNVLLGVFNLIPIPPLDGSKVLFAAIEHRAPQVVQFLERYGNIILIAFIFFGSSILTPIFGAAYEFVFSLIFA